MEKDCIKSRCWRKSLWAACWRIRSAVSPAEAMIPSPVSMTMIPIND